MTKRTLVAALALLPDDTEIVLADFAHAILEVVVVDQKYVAVITDRVEDCGHDPCPTVTG